MTYALLLANAVVFLIEVRAGVRFVEAYALWPLGPQFHLWQILTSAFLHGSLVHLAMNLFGLWMFGRDVERALGSARFVELYLVSAVTASVTQLLVTAALAQRVPTLGASGALFGVLAAYGWLFPRRVILMLFPPIALPAPLFVLAYAALELFSGVFGTQQGVAHFAHLGGLAGGFLLLWHWRARPR
ncbi:MAG: rhomboid family intramembrane serine protease [Nevskia sp.]|nr:rhomboid family intramembrane serine protease [Nevskia sp.]